MNRPLDLTADMFDEVFLAEVGVVAADLNHRLTPTNQALHLILPISRA
jgi:hypothetical protein